MIDKEELGLRIRQEREKQGLSREALCGDEAELTVRQLVRIELGQSLPSIVKLEYIVNVLGIDLSLILKGESLIIPDEYFTMKYQLFKFPSYGDRERLARKSQMIEDIYEKFFDVLPEEELYTLELSDKTVDYISTGLTPAAEEIFEDYFKQLFLKKYFSFNDLLLISYYAIQCQNKNYEKDILNLLEATVLEQKISGDEYYNIQLLGVLTAIAGVYLDHADYSHLQQLSKRMHDIIAETQQYTAKPLALIYEAKYYLYETNDVGKAKECYDLALMLAQNFGDHILEDNIKNERVSDCI